MRNNKKLTSLIIFLLLIALCCSCAPKAIMSVSDDSFSLTPDEFIANLNAVIEEQNDSRYWTIPPYTESGRDIDISGSNFSLRLDVNNDGKITAIRWDWKASKQGVTDNLLFCLIGTIYMIEMDTDTAQAIVLELDMQDPVPPKYDTSFSSSGVLYNYSTYGHAKYNTITITPDNT